jgi:hypothetical protein
MFSPKVVVLRLSVESGKFGGNYMKKIYENIMRYYIFTVISWTGMYAFLTCGAPFSRLLHPHLGGTKPWGSL